jgi:predicted DNA-binding transcriptional regulator YafY
MSRASRLLQLLQALRRNRRPVTATALADELGVSRRSVYRDIETLRAQGALVQGEAGVGYVLRPGYLLPPLMFTEEEIEAIVLGLRLTAEHGDAELGRAAADAVGKLRAALPREVGRFLDDTALVAGPAREQAREAVDLALIRGTIRRERVASITYVDAKGEATARRVWPFGLAFFEHARVVLAWCELRQDYRSFRADRVRSWSEGERAPRRRAEMLAAWRAREGIAPPAF